VKIQHLTVSGVIFLIGAAIFVINLLLGFIRRGRTLPFEGIGLMVLGLGLSTFLNL
jgi:hypothetical protein